MHHELFNALTESCRQVIAEQDQRAGTPGPKLLCHLTDIDGFMGIISSGCLWACLVTESNDASEIRYGLDLAAELLESRLQQVPRPLDLAILGFLRDPTRAPTHLRYEFAPLAISFCETCEKSGQWLHYSHSGRGVALVFAPELSGTMGLDFAKVEYNPRSQRQRIIELLDAGQRVAESAPADLNETAQVVVIWLSWLALRLKHPSFEEEQEWRFSMQVVMQDSSIVDGSVLQYRRAHDRLVPYEPRTFAPKLLKEAVLGYSSPLTPEAARLFMLSHGYDATARRSTVPVR
jgi:hypothetical protein